jgi:hypothetical protein
MHIFKLFCQPNAHPLLRCRLRRQALVEPQRASRQLTEISATHPRQLLLVETIGQFEKTEPAE